MMNFYKALKSTNRGQKHSDRKADNRADNEATIHHHVTPSR